MPMQDLWTQQRRKQAVPSRRKRRSKRAKQKRRVAICVMAVLILGLFATALILSLTRSGNQAIPVSSAAPPPAPVSEAPVISAAPPPPPPVRTATPYDEPELPPLFNHIGNNPIPSDYVLDLVDVGGGQTMQRRSAEAYMAMASAAAADGVTFTAISGYRTNQRQTNNYNNSVNNYMAQGMSREDAERATLRYYAYPGTSEHEAGLAMDIGDASVPGANIQDSFGETPAFEWLQEHAVEYGFIFRYKLEYEPITGIAYEPWHYRYVGANHAEEIVKQGVTLEEYLENIEDLAENNV